MSGPLVKWPLRCRSGCGVGVRVILQSGGPAPEWAAGEVIYIFEMIFYIVYTINYTLVDRRNQVVNITVLLQMYEQIVNFILCYLVFIRLKL